MPIYEYYCDRCKKVSSFLLLRSTEEIEPYCKVCKTKEVRRILSRVSVLKSEERRMEGLLDPGKLSGLDENDPGSVEKLMKRMGRELGDELGEGFEQEMEQAMAESESTPQEDL
jgi:putative FmdB family regulatory protein